MRTGVLAVVALLFAACDDYGAELDNTVPYPGPCSSHRWNRSVLRDYFAMEYESGHLSRIEGVTRALDGEFLSRGETSWRSNPDGSLAEVVTTLDGETLARWTFESTEVVVTVGSRPRWRVYDRASFAFMPIVGSDAYLPQAELGLLERYGVTYTWSTEGPLLVRTGEDEQATFELDDQGRILVLRRDAGANGTFEDTSQFLFEGDRLVRYTRDRGNGLEAFDWRYDAGGNVAEMQFSRDGEPDDYHEEYDYSCR